MSPRQPYIEQFLLQPLTELLNIPSLLTEQKVHYIEAIRSCTDSHLKDMFVYLRDNHAYKRFPTIAEIQVARKATDKSQAQRASRPGTQQKQPWDIRNDRIHALTKEYVDRFMSTSQLVTHARGEGWEMDLWRYVSAVASHQAQLICNDPNPGFNGAIIFDYQSNINKELVYIFKQEQQRQADAGVIDVAVPTGMIERWRRQKAWRDEHVKGRKDMPVIIASDIVVPMAAVVEQIDTNMLF